ncbi:MAG: beta/alpha barrel domain-containing protein [Leptospirales bacterium]
MEDIYRNNRFRELDHKNERIRKPISMRKSIIEKRERGEKAFVLEFKRGSASGFLNESSADPQVFAESVNEFCDAFSILTEPTAFRGNFSDSEYFLRFGKPLLMKDFVDSERIVDCGYYNNFDCILLISDFLDIEKITALSDYIRSRGMDVLVEFHDPALFDELKGLKDIIIGYNRRNLKTLRMEGEEKMISKMIGQTDNPFLLESGINYQNLAAMDKLDFDGYLIGEAVLKDRKILAEIKSREVIRYDDARPDN